jgi:hypothetical protein
MTISDPIISTNRKVMPKESRRPNAAKEKTVYPNTCNAMQLVYPAPTCNAKMPPSSQISFSKPPPLYRNASQWKKKNLGEENQE